MVTPTADLVLAALTEQDDARPRSQQAGVGPSSLGGCQRAVLYDMLRMPATNLDRPAPWEAMRGTAVHNLIESALRRIDPFAERFLIEPTVLTSLAHPRLADGHPDLIRLDCGPGSRVVDLKTTLKRKIRYFPGIQRVWQVATYAWAINESGTVVMPDGTLQDVPPVTELEILALPIDGKPNDLASFTMPYDPTVAEGAFRWLAAVADLADSYEAGEVITLPPPDRPVATFCAPYCPHYGRCPGGA